MQTEFERAIDALKRQDYQAAQRGFMQCSKAGGAEDDNLLASYLGLAQVLNDDHNGLLRCRDAASNEVVDGTVFLNLACAEWHAGNRKRAIDAIRRGVKIDASHERLNRACARLDCRKRCCFGFLPRGHRLNRLFGKLFRRSGDRVSAHQLLFSA